MQLLEWPVLAWLALAIAAAFVEVLLPHFALVFVAAGALAAAVAAELSAGGPAQITVFTVVLIVSGLALRQRLVARMGGRGLPTRTGQLIGRDAVVTDDIDPTVGTGRVNVGGEDWAARSPAVLAAGTRVRVVGADGIVLEVTPI